MGVLDQSVLGVLVDDPGGAGMSVFTMVVVWVLSCGIFVLPSVKVVRPADCVLVLVDWVAIVFKVA